MPGKTNSRRLSFEQLEFRRVLSLTFDIAAILGDDGHLAGDTLLAAAAKGGGGKGGGGGTSGPEIDLPTVVAHELGHSLGLEHSTDPSCNTANQPIMCPYYIGPAFRLKADDISKIRALYPDNNIVPSTTDDRWDDPNVTFSFMPDGTSIHQGGKLGSQLFSVMQTAIGTDWQSIFLQALDLWAEATDAQGTPDEDAADNALIFTQVNDDGSPFNFVGNGTGQGDSGVGDIRFGSHKFDGAGGVLAHAYFPPPNSATAAGDAHFAKEENWKNLSGLTLSPGAAPVGGGDNLTAAHGHGDVWRGAAPIRAARLHLQDLGATLFETPFSTAAPAGPSAFQTTRVAALVVTPWERGLDDDPNQLALTDSRARVLTTAAEPHDAPATVSKVVAARGDLLEPLDEVLESNHKSHKHNS